MLIFPAVDLKGGRCVQLVQGRPEEETVFSDKPEEIARLWQDKGARFLHIVDLDGAFTGEPQNLNIISRILAEIDIPIQLGGGLRSEDTIAKVLRMGVERVILGTAALSDPQLVKRMVDSFGERIVVGIDARESKVAIKGWQEVATKEALALAQEMEKVGVTRIIFTDIIRDGMLRGPNLESLRRVAQGVDIPVIVSGGISSLNDIKDIIQLEEIGIEGIIIGTALYTRAIELEDALELVANKLMRDEN